MGALTKIKSNSEEVIGYRDEEIGAAYRKVKTTVVWPGRSPGFVIVVAEDFGEPMGTKWRPLKVIAFTHQSSLHELAKVAGTFSNLYLLKTWYADKEGEGVEQARLFLEFARDLGLKDLYLIQPSLKQELQPALQILRRRFNDQSLKYPEESIFEEKLEVIKSPPSKDLKLEDHQEVFWLAVLVHEFDRSHDSKLSHYKSPRPPSAMAV